MRKRRKGQTGTQTGRDRESWKIKGQIERHTDEQIQGQGEKQVDDDRSGEKESEREK